MKYTVEQLYKTFNDIKHWGLMLDEEAIKDLIKNINKNIFSEEQTGLSFHCLALGSYYLEKNPNFFKYFFKQEISEILLSDIFKSIEYAKLGRFYIDELEHYMKLETFLDEYPVSSEAAFYAFGRTSEIDNKTKQLETNLNKAYNIYNSLSFEKDSDIGDEVFDYINICINILAEILCPNVLFVHYDANEIYTQYDATSSWQNHIVSAISRIQI
jgi:hypothetical protein